MRTIGFFGDSFCADRSKESWCTILSDLLGCGYPVSFGEPGQSIWSVFFKFNELIRQNQVPNISIFCWTEPYRLYHPRLVLTANTVAPAHADPMVYKTLDNYWKYLHSYEKDEICYSYALQYYDQNILSKLKSQIVQMWSFRPFETADKDAGIRLKSGTFIDESMFAFGGNKPGRGVNIELQQNINHMTVEQNQKWADRVFNAYVARY